MTNSENSNANDLSEDAVFLAETVLPDAAAAFALPKDTLASALQKADVVLDTNVLLLPYQAGSSSLKEIETALARLRDSDRLFIPGRVAREFARLRPLMLGRLLHALSSQSELVAVPDSTYPLLADLPEHGALADAVGALKAARANFVKAVGTLRSRILSWDGNDPVSVVYSRLFATRVRDTTLDKSKVLKELRRRVEHKIPPGYKDASKPDGGVGDLLIWLTILELGRERKNPLIFVTGEEKSDWQYRSERRGIGPRVELVDEYRRASQGANIYIIQMSELLQLLKVKNSAVEEIKLEEQRGREKVVEHVECPNCDSVVNVELAKSIGSSATPMCPACGAHFHVHRGGEGVFARARGGVPRVEGQNNVKVECPYCTADVSVKIGRGLQESAVPTCTSCGERFHAHRARDASVFTRRRGTRAPEPDGSPAARV